jgi:hypothetical protein
MCLYSYFVLLGHDGLPVDAMNTLNLNEANSTATATPTHMTGGGVDNMNFDPELPAPTPPMDNDQMAAWYDTDL